MDPTGLVWRAVDVLADQPERCPEWDSLIVDGFDDLSPVQTELIISLAQLLPDVTVTVTRAKDGSERQLVHKRFNHLQAELDSEARDRIYYYYGNTKDGESIFDKLENILFSSSLEEPLAAGDRIKMVAVPDREAEIREAFRWIKNLISAGACRTRTDCLDHA